MPMEEGVIKGLKCQSLLPHGKEGHYDPNANTLPVKDIVLSTRPKVIHMAPSHILEALTRDKEGNPAITFVRTTNLLCGTKNIP